MKIKLRVQRISAVDSQYFAGGLELGVMVEMTDNQFLDAILSALETVSGEKWEKWKEIIDGDDGK